MPDNTFHNSLSLIPNRQDYLSRARIDRLLELAVQKPLTTIVAGAGYGKTQAVYGFLQKKDFVTIWLQMSMFDNLASRLWEDYAYSVSLVNEEFGAKLRMLGFPDTIAAYNTFLTYSSSYFDPNKKYVLVYDDFHLIHDKAIMQFLERLIEARIPSLSIILISRSEPDLNMAVLFSKGLVSQINEDVLRFEEKEMRQYFQMQGVKTSTKNLADIYKYTDGWIFAISLIGLFLRRRPYYEGDVLDMVKGNIFRLLESEVFAGISEEMKTFLIKISLIENVPLTFLKELFPNSGELLREMFKISSFIRYDAFMNTCRIHHLFLSFLRDMQNTLDANEIAVFYEKAANWYAKNGCTLDAITYYEKIKKYSEIIDIIFSYPTILPEETALFLLELLERATKEMSDNNYLAAIFHARFLLNLERYEECFTEASLLKEKYEALPKTDENLNSLCGIYVNMGISCLYRGLHDFVEYYRLAYETGKKTLKKDYSLIVINYACKVSCPKEGEFDKYVMDLAEFTRYTDVMHGFGFGLADLASAELAYFQRDLKKAENHAHKAIYKAQQKRQIHIEYMAIFYLIRINVSLGHFTKIVSLFDHLETQYDILDTYSSYNMIDIISGWFYSLIGETDKVAQWIKEESVNRKATLNNYGLEWLTKARFLFAQKKYYETLALLENLELSNKIGEETLGLIEIKVIKAVCFYRIDEHEEAFLNLRSAYELAAPNSLDMPFVEQGKNMRTLARAAIKSNNCGIPEHWLESIEIKSSTYAKKLSHIINEYKNVHYSKSDMFESLSERELEVLTDLCHGLSREEISVNCNLSTNTIKSMLQNIYGKLGASNMVDAVRIAVINKLVK